jgi:predicted benzoate:H+ symporter BenE
MKPIDPVELSGFIDREMTEERSEELRQVAADTASLHEELERLSRADSRWRAAARSAAFRVEIRLHREKLFTFSAAQASLLIAFLMGIRFLPKLMSTLTLGFALNGIALAIVIAWIVAMTRETEHRISASV